MSGLFAVGLIWSVGADRHRIEPDPLVARPRRITAVVVPTAPVGRALADVLAGLAGPAAGSIELSGPGRVALVPPGGALLPHLTVAENIAYGPATRGREHRRVAVEPAARLLQVDSLLDLPAARLSAGQRLRAGLARAYAAGPAAVVVEDRAGLPPCAAAVTAVAAAGLAVLVLTDDRGRLPADGVAAHEAVPVGAGRHHVDQP